MSDAPIFASSSISRHLARGVVGFGLLGGSFALIQVAGFVSFLLAPLGLVALRGCPMCWTMGLIETIARGRVKRECIDDECRLTTTSKTDTAEVR